MWNTEQTKCVSKVKGHIMWIQKISIFYRTDKAHDINNHNGKMERHPLASAWSLLQFGVVCYHLSATTSALCDLQADPRAALVDSIATSTVVRALNWFCWEQAQALSTLTDTVLQIQSQVNAPLHIFHTAKMYKPEQNQAKYCEVINELRNST